MAEVDLYEINFASLGTEHLIRLAEDFVRALPSVTRDPPRSQREEGWISLISEVASRAETSSSFSQDGPALAETFRQAMRFIHLSDSFMRDLWIRVYAHAFLRGSHVFPGIELHKESPEYESLGFVDVWKGKYHGNLVCIKAIRTRKKDNLGKIKKTFYQGIGGCKHFSHPNVLPVVQVSESLFPLCIMSPWMAGGNIMQYIQKNPIANRLMLLAEVCHGLSYLHTLEITHGCIAPGNILVTRDGRACLGDFGIVAAFGDLSFPRFKLGTARYMALERLNLSNAPPSAKSDIYSLAMTSFTVLTGVLPYGEVRGHYTLMVRIKSGERPARPTSPDGIRWLQDKVWDMITACWSENEAQRWRISAICNLFSAVSLLEVQKVKSDIKTGGQQRSTIRFRPRIASFFRFLIASEPEIEKQVSEMDERLEHQSMIMSDRERLKLFNELCKTCSRHRVIPRSMHLPDCSNEAAQVDYAGGFANVSKSTYEGHQVAVKVVRVYATNLKKVLSGFCREVVAWKHLRHPNILPLLGVTVREDRFAMVSEWMENGNISEFVRKDCDANRTALLADVANGLKYMHDLSIVHGDLKGANILINNDRRACIADFSLTTLTRGGDQTFSLMSTLSADTLVSFTAGGTPRWMSPELLDPDRFGTAESDGDRPTRESDCYALGMVIYEVLSGHYPFYDIASGPLIVNAIIEGVRPAKPDDAASLGFNDELWKIVEQCWREKRAERPNVEEISSCLNDATAFWYMREF